MSDLNYQLRAAANYIDKLGGDSKSYRAALNLAEAAKQCRDDGRCQYAIDHGAEGMAACPVGKCCMPRAPLSAQQAPADVLRKIADLASLGSSYGMLADGYCDQIAEIVRTALAATPAPQAAPSDTIAWDAFPSWLIDHHEGEPISELLLQVALGDMLAAAPAVAITQAATSEPVAPDDEP